MMAARHPKWSHEARTGAEQLGQHTYSGAPCSHAETHTGPDGTTKRYVGGAQCVQCTSLRLLSLRRRSRALRLTNRNETFIGRPCSNGHDGTRYRSNKKCVFCHHPSMGSERGPSLSMAPNKPRNPVPDNGWPFGYVDEQGVHHGKTFRDHPNPVAGKYVPNLRKLPLRVGTWGVSA